MTEPPVQFSRVRAQSPAKGTVRIREAEWYTGLDSLQHYFWQFGDVNLVISGWVTLFLVSWILGYSVVVTRSLYFAIGLHAGWIFALRSFGKLTKGHVSSSVWMGRELMNGVIPALCLILTLFAIRALLKNRQHKLSP